MGSRVGGPVGKARTRVLHVVPGLGGGGIETFVSLMTDALGDDFEFSLHTWRNGITYEPPWPPLAVGPELDLARRGRALSRALRRYTPSIVHFYDPVPFLFGTYVVWLSRSRAHTILHGQGVYARGGSRSVLGRAAGRWAYGRCSRVLACSQYVADILRSNPNVPAERLCVLHNCADVSRFAAATPNTGLRERLNVQTGDTLGLFLGRLSIEHKGLDVLCQAMHMIPAHIRLRMALVGPGDLKGTASELEPPSRVTLHGPVYGDAATGLLKAADFFVYPSRAEAFGISIVEAMAAGLPVIATAVGGIPEIVEDGVSGLLVPPQDAQALAGAIERLVEHPEERAAIGARAHERAKRFDVKIIAGQLRDIYQRVLES